MTNDIELTAYAATLEINTKEPVRGADWEKGLVKFFDLLAKLCREKPVLAIGHIKGFLQLDDQAGSCYFSTTGSSRGTATKGQLSGTASHGKLDFNVLVYGIDKGSVEQITNIAVQALEEDLQADCQVLTLVNPAKQ